MTQGPRGYAAAFAILIALIGGSVAAKEILFSDAAMSVTARAESNVLSNINKQRAAKGLPPLKLDPQLRSIARTWSVAMLQTGKFGHGDFEHRLYAAVGRRHMIAEDLGLSSPGVVGIVSAWMASPPHRRNILLTDAKRIGIGVAVGRYKGRDQTALVTADFSS